MALITTPGAANADSYASVLEADAYNASRPYSEAWVGSESVKEAALKEARRLLDSSFRWTGVASSSTQALTWPRTGMLTRNGFPLPTDVIPIELKEAQSELARQLLETDRTADDEAARLGIEGVKAGPVEIKFKRAASSNSLALREADINLRGPDFAYLSAMIPDAVLNLIPPSWYSLGSVVRSGFFFEVSR